MDIELRELIFSDRASLSPDAFESMTVIVRGIGDETSVGYQVAQAFARHGADIVLAGASKARLKAAAKSCEEYGAETMLMHRGNEDPSTVALEVESIIERFGRIDALVNAALIAKPQLLKDARVHDIERVLDSCTIIPFAWMRACLPHLARTHGSIVSLGSSSAEEGLEGLGALAAATQGFAALNAVAAREWSELGVTTNVVQSAARTVTLDRLMSEFAEDALSVDIQEISQGLKSSFEELARACLYLCSPEGHEISGQIICV